MTCGLQHMVTDHRFEDREGLGRIPEQGLPPGEDKHLSFPSFTLAYEKEKGKKTLFNTKKKKQFRNNNNESNNNLEIKAA